MATRISSHLDIGARVALLRDGEWLPARIELAIDDESTLCTLSFKIDNLLTYAERVPHASVANGAAMYWMWAAEATALVDALARAA